MLVRIGTSTGTCLPMLVTSLWYAGQQKYCTYLSLLVVSHILVSDRLVRNYMPWYASQHRYLPTFDGYELSTCLKG
jgi:hypothetical protein